MDEPATKVVELFGILPPLIGLIANLVSRKYSSDLIRYSEACEDAYLEELNIQFRLIISYFSNEINKILTQLFVSDKAEEIDLIDIEDKSIDFKRLNLRIYKKNNLYVQRLDFATKRIVFFRWLFLLIFVSAVFLNFIIYKWDISIPQWILITFTSISFFSLVSFFIDRIISSNLLDKIKKEYGIPD